MSHIKGRLKQYKDKYSDCYKYAGVYVKVIQDIIEQLQADLEQDEKENGWTPVSERLPEKHKDVMKFVQNEDGTFNTYDDTYDITIHCETEEEQKKVIEHLRGIKLQEDQMGRCKLDCPDGETECCICCTKQDSCQCRCDDMDSYEYAEECEDYETD